MNSHDFAKELHKRKCNQIASMFGESNNDISKGLDIAPLDYARNQKLIHSRAITNRVSEDSFEKSLGVQVSEDVFQKAVKDMNLEVYTADAINAFVKDLKVIVASGRTPSEVIEKAKKDLGRLVKTTVTDKNGQKRTVWIKPGEDPNKSNGSAEGGGESQPKKYISETKTKEEGDHIISRAQAALDNPRTPQSMRSKATEMIAAEKKKWEKEHEAHSDYSHPEHPNHAQYKEGQEADHGTSHTYDKTTSDGEKKAAAWEARQKQEELNAKHHSSQSSKDKK